MNEGNGQDNAYINEQIVIEQSIEEKRYAHEEGRKGEIKWHKLHTFRSNHQILRAHQGKLKG